MGTMKSNVRVVGWALAAALLIAAILYAQDPRFWNRYVLLLKNDGILPQRGWAGSEFSVAGVTGSRFELAQDDALTISKSALQAVDEYAAERNSTALLVWHRGALVWRSHYQGYDPDKLIVSKSMAKMVAGIVVARAIKEGYIKSLDEPAATYLQEWQDTDKAAITVRHLLHMAAGFEPFYTRSMNPFGSFMRAYIAGHNESTLLDGYDLIDTPGAVYDYSQAVSDLLGLVLERATNKPYGQYLSESVLIPIGAQGGEVMLNRPGGLAHSGCCLLLPSESWLRLGILLLRGGVVDGQPLFPDNWMADYLAPSPANPTMGLHIWLSNPYFKSRSWSEVGEATGFGVLHSEPYVAQDLFLFDGNGHQVVYIAPSEELVVVRTGGFTFATGNTWDNAFIPNTLIRGVLESTSE